MRMGQGVRTGLGHGGITCVLQTQFSSLLPAELQLRGGIEDNLKIHWWIQKCTNFDGLHFILI